MSGSKKTIIVIAAVLLIIGCVCGALIFFGERQEANREVLSQA